MSGLRDIFKKAFVTKTEAFENKPQVISWLSRKMTLAVKSIYTSHAKNPFQFKLTLSKLHN